MQEAQYTFDYSDLERFPDVEIVIYVDPEPEHPLKDWDFFGSVRTFVTPNGFGIDMDEGAHKEMYDSPSKLKKFVAEHEIVSLPVYMLNHHIIAVSTQSFNDPWDSAQIGLIFATRDEIEQEFGGWNEETKSKARQVFERTIKNWDMYLKNEVYGIVLTKDNETIDSIWDLYDEDGTYVQAEAQKMYINYTSKFTTEDKAREFITADYTNFLKIPRKKQTEDLAYKYIELGGDIEDVREDLRTEYNVELYHSRKKNRQ